MTTALYRLAAKGAGAIHTILLGRFKPMLLTAVTPGADESNLADLTTAFGQKSVDFTGALVDYSPVVLGEGAMSRLSILVFMACTLAACENAVPCEGGCVDVCSGFGKNKCAVEYNKGYSLGYASGLRGQHTFGINPDAFVAGYYDGFADGSVGRR